MLPFNSAGHRSSLATFSRLRPTCSAESSRLADRLRSSVPYVNSPRQHDLRKDFVHMVGGSFRVTLPSGLSFSCPRGQHVHSSGSTSGDLRAPRIPGLTTSLDASSLPPNFEGHWRKFRDLCILRETAAVHAELQGHFPAGPGLGQRSSPEEGGDAAEEDAWDDDEFSGDWAGDGTGDELEDDYGLDTDGWV